MQCLSPGGPKASQSFLNFFFLSKKVQCFNLKCHKGHIIKLGVSVLFNDPLKAHFRSGGGPKVLIFFKNIIF